MVLIVKRRQVFPKKKEKEFESKGGIRVDNSDFYEEPRVTGHNSTMKFTKATGNKNAKAVSLKSSESGIGQNAKDSSLESWYKLIH